MTKKLRKRFHYCLLTPIAYTKRTVPSVCAVTQGQVPMTLVSSDTKFPFEIGDGSADLFYYDFIVVHHFFRYLLLAISELMRIFAAEYKQLKL